jgi:hypothetical protein
MALLKVSGVTSVLAMLAMGADLVAPANAAEERGYEFGYFLPRTSFGAVAAERLIKCPELGDATARQAVIATTVLISSATKPDPGGYVRLDTRSGFLAKRTTEIKLNRDGTLSAFNGSTEGQGDAVIGAVIKVATGVAGIIPGAGMLAAPLTAAAPEAAAPRLSFSCTLQTRQKVEERDRLAEQVAALEELVASGEGRASVVALLEIRRAAFAQADDDLTVTSKQVLTPLQSAQSGSVLIERFEANHWFQGNVPTSITQRIGSNGFELSWAADNQIAAALKRSSWQTGIPAEPQAHLLYRRPIPVAVKVVSCQIGRVGCAPDESHAIADAKLIYVAQFSPIFTVRLGRGGIFGSREAEADFDASGAPTRLKYGSAAGGAAIASVINAAGDGYASMNGAAAAARDRQLQLLRDRKEYRDLMTALNGAQ